MSLVRSCLSASRALPGGRRALASLPRTARPSPAMRSSTSTSYRQAPFATDAAPPAEGARSVFAPLDTFTRRHVGPQPASVSKMLDALGYQSMDAFIEDCLPSAIRIGALTEDGPKGIKALGEQELLARAKELADKNKVFRSFIGMGYSQAVVPPVILRNMTENHSWFSQYTAYQPEISQGRLESLINFQTLTSSLTGLDIANASLLDEGTAAAEAMVMSYGDAKSKKHTYVVDEGVLPQTIAVLKTRAAPFGIKVLVGNATELLEDEAVKKDLAGVMVQYPNQNGAVQDWAAVADTTHKAGALLSAATDFLALTVLKPPGEWGADIAFGNSARFGVPLGYGGPHAAFFACKDKLKRKIPGRLVGLSKDVDGKPAYRLALQTREQHIRRDKATSNICTAQALLANMAAMYAVYHGSEGLRQIAEKVHDIVCVVRAGLEKLGHSVVNESFFDTLTVRLADGVSADAVHAKASENKINFRPIDANTVAMSFDESNTLDDIADLLNVFATLGGSKAYTKDSVLALAQETHIPDAPATSASQGKAATGKGIPPIDSDYVPSDLRRTSPFLTQPIWNTLHSETDILRYMHYLQSKDLSLVHAMIPLGSCTMKLNATSAMTPFTWPEFAKIHPFAPAEQCGGYHEMMEELSKDLCTLTGFHGCSLQPNSGAQGEYAGLSTIRAYHKSRGDDKRNICLIPVSAHGTNPASAVMAGMKVVPVKTLVTGELDMKDLEEKAIKYKDTLSSFMLTYPSTYGTFEPGVQKACQIIHDNGGQVYLDGANMNAMVGLTSPGRVGADVCHLNLHKTFSIPHGGGGPGVGPICCAEHLTPFLPGHPIDSSNTLSATNGPVSAAAFGSASITSISWAYIRMLGAHGLTYSSQVALLSANYAADRLKNHYKLGFTNDKGRCAHEFLIDLAEFDASAGLKVMDFAKRLQDFGIHPPTCSWPLSTAMLIEPTESEGLRDIDALCDAMIKIREEVDEIVAGKQPKEGNVIKRAPHTMETVSADTWDRPYSREQAAFPIKSLRNRKFWPKTSRLDDAYGDLNLICECGTVEQYE